jgi:uncharacterized membrane protein (UPF0182 family)
MPQDPFPRASNQLPIARRGPLAYTIAALVVVAIIFASASGFYADFLWYKAVGYTQVWRVQLVTRGVLFLVFGLLSMLIVLSNVWLAYRKRPVYAPVAMNVLDQYRTTVDRLKKLIFIGLGVASFFFAGSSGSALWRTWLLWRNSTPFGVKDPQFHMDVSFFAFTLPWLQALLGWAFSVLLFSTVAAVAVHYLYGGIAPQNRGQRASVVARVQISVLLGFFVLLKAAAYWLDRYALALKEGRLFTGLSYTGVNASLPAKTILAAIAILCALLFFANIVRRSWTLPIAGVALLAVSALLIDGIYPTIVQQFQVKPSESSKERPFIQRNIDATRAAYGIDNVQVTDYRATTTATAGQLQNDAQTTASIRLIDPNLISATFRNLQQIKPYYSFPDSLDIDRYKVNGVVRDMVVAVRELDLAGAPSRNWINDHLVYTHGFGFTAAYGNVRDADGKPQFAEGNIPPTGVLGTFQPRVYFGENSPDYSIIGAPIASAPAELDYPDDASANGQKNYTYAGKGGIPMGSLLNRFVFAIKYKEQNILLSNLINKDSRILFVRSPKDRVQKVAPWLTLDGDPYPSIVNGKIVWIVDGYTTSDGYPNSKKTLLSNATTDSLTNATNSTLLQSPVNYIRNSVKATVDAYDGTVSLYAWDPNDPVLKAWSRAYPGTVLPKSAMSQDLLDHVRYPEDLFRVQRDVLSQYHVTTAAAFYGGQDFWRIPTDPSSFGQNGSSQPPYYLTLKMPGATKASFSLTTAFVPRGSRENLSAFASVISEAGPDYGKIQVLQVPRSTNIAGPSQVSSNFEGRPAVSTTLTLLRQGGSDVVLGNLLTLPVGGGLLYVQPVYVKATASAASYPLLQKVLVAFGDQIGFDDTLQGALDQVFGGNAGVNTGGTPGGTPSGTGGGTTPGTTNGTVASALADAQRAIAAGQAALAKGDFAGYGKAQDALKAAIARAITAQHR